MDCIEVKATLVFVLYLPLRVQQTYRSLVILFMKSASNLRYASMLLVFLRWPSVFGKIWFSKSPSFLVSYECYSYEYFWFVRMFLIRTNMRPIWITHSYEIRTKSGMPFWHSYEWSFVRMGFLRHQEWGRIFNNMLCCYGPWKLSIILHIVRVTKFSSHIFSWQHPAGNLHTSTAFPHLP